MNPILLIFCTLTHIPESNYPIFPSFQQRTFMIALYREL